MIFHLIPSQDTMNCYGCFLLTNVLDKLKFIVKKLGLKIFFVTMTVCHGNVIVGMEMAHYSDALS